MPQDATRTSDEESTVEVPGSPGETILGDSRGIGGDAPPAHLLILGDSRRIPLANRSVHCVVTSPPYFGLRDYGTATWVGGDPACEHRGIEARTVSGGAGKQYTNQGSNRVYSGDCACGARRVDTQLGLEPTPEAFVAALVGVFREVWRVLRDDGTVWLNCGDSYAGTNGGYNANAPSNRRRQDNPNSIEGNFKISARLATRHTTQRNTVTGVLKPKDLIGIPWMLAFALRADGWYLRSDCVWSKPNPMRESVRDRPTKSHEYLFLLSKRERYYCDMEAIKTKGTGRLDRWPGSRGRIGEQGWTSTPLLASEGANKLSVWTVPTCPTKLAHFATFPPKLIVPCIKAGTSQRGVCRKCGAPWRRLVTRKRVATRPGLAAKSNGLADAIVGKQNPGRHVTASRTVGWESSCGCLEARYPVPAIVLDPFVGVGTTPMVATLLGRRGIGCDLKPANLEMAARRIARAHRPVSKLDPAPARAPLPGQLSLFGEAP